jgi:hypothetical protein
MFIKSSIGKKLKREEREKLENLEITIQLNLKHKIENFFLAHSKKY